MVSSLGLVPSFETCVVAVGDFKRYVIHALLTEQ